METSKHWNGDFLRKLSLEVRRRVFKMWLEGYTYRAISNRLDLGLGTISRIIDEYRSRTPDLDELRALNLQLKKLGSCLYDAFRGAACLEEMNQLGVSLNEAEAYSKTIKKISESRRVKPETFVDGAMKLMRLEDETRKTYMEIIKEFSNKQRGIEALAKKTNSLRMEIKSLNRELKSLEQQRIKLKADYASTDAALRQLTNTQNRLKRLGLKKIGRLAEFVENFEVLRYDAREVKELANLKEALLEIRVNAADLKCFIGNKRRMDSRMKKLRTQLKLLEAQVKRLEKQKNSLSNQNESMQIASSIIEKRTTLIACSYCGRILMFPLPSRWQLDDAIKKNLIYPIRCFICGCINQIEPQDMLASIGWAILE